MIRLIRLIRVIRVIGVTVQEHLKSEQCALRFEAKQGDFGSVLSERNAALVGLSKYRLPALGGATCIYSNGWAAEWCVWQAKHTRACVPHKDSPR